MKVLHYLPGINRSAGGVVTAMIDLCNALSATGIDVRVTTFGSRDIPGHWDGTRGPAVTVDESLRSRGVLSRSVQPVLLDAVKQVDLVHLHTPWDPLNLDWSRACRAAGVPYVVTMHGMIDNWSMNNGWLKGIKKRAFLRLAGRKFMQGAAAVHSTAQAEADQAKVFLPGARFVVLPCLFDPGDLFDVERLPGRDFRKKQRVLYLSRLHPKKRPDLLIDVAAMDPEIEIVLAGPGDDDYVTGLHAKCEALGVADRVHFLGMVSGPERTRAYAEADCFCLPTSQENFGLVLPEAMAAAMPTVTTRGTAIWRELEGAGAWITSQEPADIFAALSEIRGDPDGAQVRAERGRQWVKDALVPDVLAPRYHAMYEKFVGSH